MRSILLILTALAVLTSPGATFAGFGEIVASYRSPPKTPVALARSNTHLYVYCKNDELNPMGWIYKLVPSSGSVIGSFPLRVEPTLNYAGLTFTGANSLWTANQSYGCVYQLNAKTGSIMNSWFVYYHIVTGMAAEHNQAQGGRAKGLWITATQPSVLGFFTTGGSPRLEYLWQEHTADIGWDYNHELIWGRFVGEGAPYVYGFTREGSVVASFPGPAGDNPIHGCAFYEGYLWLSATRTQTGYIPYIWQVDVRCLTAVNPASVGRVKALFR
jgi:hypothetical protein